MFFWSSSSASTKLLFNVPRYCSKMTCIREDYAFSLSCYKKQIALCIEYLTLNIEAEKTYATIR